MTPSVYGTVTLIPNRKDNLYFPEKYRYHGITPEVLMSVDVLGEKFICFSSFGIVKVLHNSNTIFNIHMPIFKTFSKQF